MADIIATEAGHKGPGVKKSKKRSTRVDLTPMVDLGFLLITFFIFTTRISQPTALKLFLPADAPPTPLKASEALTLLLGRSDVIYYYAGELRTDASALSTTNYRGIRNIIIDTKKSMNANDLVIVIKPQKESVYRNAVDALDEMTINDIRHYAMTDISPEEERLMEAAQRKNADR